MRFYRIVLNFASSLSRNVLGLLLGLIATPIILQYLGTEKFGAFRVLLDWYAQLGILEFGLYTALLPIFSKSLSQSGKLSPNFVKSMALRLYAKVVVYQVVGVIFIFSCLEYLVPVKESNTTDLRLGFLIIASSLIFTGSQVYRAYLDSAQRGYILSLSMALQNIINIAAAVTAAYLGWGIKGQAFAYFLGVASSFTLLFIQTRKISATHQGSHDETVFINSLKQRRGTHFMAFLCGRVSFLIDNLLISAILGAKAVTAFYLTQRLLLIAMQQLQQLGNSTWPAISDLYHNSENDKFANRIVEVTEFIAYAAGALLTVMVFINPSFVVLWTGESSFAGEQLSNLVILNVGLISISSFWIWCFTGTGKLKVVLPMLIVQAVVNLAVSFIGTYQWGILGPPLGTFISFLLISQPWTTYHLSKEFNVPWLSLSRAWIVPMVLPLAISLAALHYFGNFTIDSWIQLAVVSAVMGMTLLVVFLFLLVRKQYREQTQQRIKLLILKKTGQK